MNDVAAVDAAKAERAQLSGLLLAVAARDRLALKALYDRTSAKLYGICLRVLGNEADAQDALQDVFVTVWRKAAVFDRSRASPITWLAVIARNKAIDRLRRRRAPADRLDAIAELPDDAPSALDIIEESEDANRLANCLGELDERARSMIRSAFFDGATYAELAQREAVPLPTMKSWIRRGLQRLRGCMER